MSDAGYEPTVRSTSEQEANNTKTVQKFMFILQQFPNNPALAQIAQKRMLEIVDLSPDELKQVEESQKQATLALQQGPQLQQGVQQGQLQQDVQQRLQSLSQMA